MAKRKNVHGRIGVKKPLPTPTEEDARRAVFQDGWRQGQRYGRQVERERISGFLHMLTKQSKATDIKRKIKDFLEDASATAA